MGSVTRQLHKHRLIALDTCVWIYHFEQHPRFGKTAGDVLDAVANGHCRAAISELTLMELLTGPLKLDRQDVADEYELLLSHYPNLSLVPVTRNVLLDAAQIRASHGFNTPDAIILATARQSGASLVVTNDRRWGNFPGVKVLFLGE
ncbi:MAG: PIN domain-containing protein [Haliea sp.]